MNQYIQAIFLLEESVDRRFDCRELGQVEEHRDQTSFAGPRTGSDVLYGALDLLR